MVPRESCLTPQQTQCLGWYLGPGAGQRGLGVLGAPCPCPAQEQCHRGLCSDEGSGGPQGSLPRPPRNSAIMGSALIAAYLGTEGLKRPHLQSLCVSLPSQEWSQQNRGKPSAAPSAWVTVIAVEPQSLETALISCLRSSWMIDGSHGPSPHPQSCTNLQTKTILANR